MYQAHALETRQQQTQRADPRQILASEILTWTTPELEAAVERELSENPALELRESASSGEPLAVSSAPPPLRLTREEEYHSSSGGRAAGDTAEHESVMERLPSLLSLRDHLRGQVGRTGDRETALIRYLIEWVDDRGYLIADLEEAAERFAVTRRDVEATVRAALQAMDPPGVGARSLRECLSLQAEYLEQSGEGNPLARAILSRCWDDLTARRADRIAARLRAPLTEVETALSFIRSALTPYPAFAFRPHGHGGSPAGLAAVRPDLVFRRTEAGLLDVEITRDYGDSLMLAPLWQRLAEGRAAAAEEDGMRRYVREHVDRAQSFLHGLSRRGRTLRAIGAALTDLQAGYLETGSRAFLRPLTRQMLSEQLGLDESVISRAVADKWAQLPGGDLVPLDAFFGCAQAAREALAALIAEEDPGDPYSDERIAALLTEKGFPLARRTVVKYRSLEKILPARLRKQRPRLEIIP